MPFVDAENFDEKTNLIFLPTETREVVTNDGKIKVSRVIIQYNYGTAEEPRVDKLQIRFPELTTGRGINQMETEREIDDVKTGNKTSAKVVRSSIGGPIVRS